MLHPPPPLGQVYEGQVYYSLGPLSKSVPILTCGGVSKRFVVPGWRVGWVLIHDKKGAFKAEVCQTCWVFLAGGGRVLRTMHVNRRCLRSPSHTHTHTHTHTIWCLVCTLMFQVTPGVKRLAMKILGPNTLVQAALPDMLRNTPPSFFQRNLRILEESAKLCYSGLKDVPGLHPVMPAASMYMMVCGGGGAWRGDRHVMTNGGRG